MLQTAALAVKAVCFGPWNVYQECSGSATGDRPTSTPTVWRSFAFGFKNSCFYIDKLCNLFALAAKPNPGEEGIPLQTKPSAQWRRTRFANTPRWLNAKPHTTCLCSTQVVYSCTIAYQSTNEGDARLLLHYTWCLISEGSLTAY